MSYNCPILDRLHGRIQREDRGSGSLAPEKSQKYRDSKQNLSGSPEKSHKATKLGSSSARQRNAGYMAFSRWLAILGPQIVIFVWFLSLPHQQRKRFQTWTHSDKTAWIRAWLATFAEIRLHDKGKSLIS